MKKQYFNQYQIVAASTSGSMLPFSIRHAFKISKEAVLTKSVNERNGYVVQPRHIILNNGSFLNDIFVFHVVSKTVSLISAKS